MPAADAADAPVSPSEAAELLNPLQSFRHVALAVSGGGDSMALMWLSARWVQEARDPPRLTVLTVDHGLRPEAAHEAARVVEQARELRFPAIILRWRGDKPTTGVQARARAARYELLAHWCIDNGAGALVTAHSLDDQAETFLMRLARGSGVDGLAAMRPLYPLREDKVAILRPLLGIPRSRLRSTLAAGGIEWIEDPANEDPRFERVRWRRALKLVEQEGLTSGTIALAARRLERARQALEHATSRLEAAAVAHETRHATFRFDALQDEPEELRLRLLRRLIVRYGAGGEPPELSALERLSAWMSEGVGGGRTLAGCRIARRKDWVRISREPPRRQVGGLPRG